MERTTADTIKEITKKHLEENEGLLLGQCISAVGWIGGTVPDVEGIVEIPMTDIAAPGFAVGCALMGKRPIFVVRYQGFMWYNASSIVNYAAKTKSVWGIPAPVFIRSIAMEGNGIGHTASSSLHSIFMHSPGLPVVAPMTPGEYESIWKHFMDNDDPIYVSEHRRSFPINYEFENHIEEKPDITIIAISAARLNAVEAIQQLKEEGIVCSLIHLVWLKPLGISDDMLAALKASKAGLVIDTDYEITGASTSIAYELMHLSGKPVHALGLEDKVCGVAQRLENITPDKDKIINKIRKILD